MFISCLVLAHFSDYKVSKIRFYQNQCTDTALGKTLLVLLLLV